MGVKASASAEDLILFLHTRKCQPPKVLCKGKLRSQQTPLQSRDILHHIFLPMLLSQSTGSHMLLPLSHKTRVAHHQHLLISRGRQVLHREPWFRQWTQGTLSGLPAVSSTGVFSAAETKPTPKAQGRGRAQQSQPFPVVHEPAAKAQHCSCG